MIRAVVVIAAHGVEEKLRSWSFWLVVLALPVVMVVAGVVPLLTDPDLRATVNEDSLALVIPDPKLAEDLAELDLEGLSVERVDALPEGRSAVVLETGEAHPLWARVVVPEGRPAELARRRGRAVLRRARRVVFLEEEEQARLASSIPDDAPEVTASGVADMFVLASGFMAVMGLVSGLSAATQLLRTRDSEFFHVLRLSTSTTALYLGGLLERMLLGLVLWGPILGVPAVLVAVVALLVGAAHPEQIPWLVLGLPLGLVLSAGCGYLTGASVGSMAGRIGGGSQKGPRLGSTLLLVAVMPLALWLASWDSSAPGVWLLFPVAGLPLGLKGVDRGLPVGWLAVAVAVQLGWTAGVTWVGTWAYAVEDEPLEDLRRRWGRA